MTAVTEPDHVQYDEHGRVLAYLDQQEEAHKRAARDYLDNMPMSPPQMRVTSGSALQ